MRWLDANAEYLSWLNSDDGIQNGRYERLEIGYAVGFGQH